MKGKMMNFALKIVLVLYLQYKEKELCLNSIKIIFHYWEELRIVHGMQR